MRFIRLVFLLSLLTGCAYNQSIKLINTNEPLRSPRTIVIVDNRDESDRKTRLVYANCARWYGDQFLAPTKTAYLKHLLSLRSATDLSLTLVLDRFYTVEYCDLNAARAANHADPIMAGAISGGGPGVFVGIGLSIFMPRQVPSASDGNLFILHVAGSVNGRPFDITRGFNYGDIEFVYFPSESPIYRQRIAEVLNETVDAILALAKK